MSRYVREGKENVRRRDTGLFGALCTLHTEKDVHIAGVQVPPNRIGISLGPLTTIHVKIPEEKRV